jgi:hypothetical protein
LAFDEHMLVLASQAGIPIHFCHGVPALSSWEGQSCAALADVLGNGLSQERVRRLMRHSSLGATISLPEDWAEGLPPQAGLFTIDQWRRALRSAREKRSEADAAENSLMPLLELLAQGLAGAEQAGKTFLRGASLGLWKDALRNAPAAAVAMSLDSLRIRDGRDPANSVVWCPASHLIGAPRRWTRLLGLAGRSWPRSETEDLGWYKPHVGPGDCLANGLRVSRIVLLPLDVGLHIGRRDQPHGVTQCLQLARPVVRRGAGFDTDQTWR